MAVETSEDLACFFDFDEFGVSAEYEKTDGSKTNIIVLHKNPDETIEFGDTTIITDTNVFKVRVSEVSAPVKGDKIKISSDVFAVQDKPKADNKRQIWTISARQL